MGLSFANFEGEAGPPEPCCGARWVSLDRARGLLWIGVALLMENGVTSQFRDIMVYRSQPGIVLTMWFSDLGRNEDV